MADASTSAVATQKLRADQVWQQNAGWGDLYQDAYDYAIPFRKPGGLTASKRAGDRLFDMTAPTSAMNLAGELQLLLFSQPPTLTAGALPRQQLALEGPQGAKKLAALERELERTGEFIYPFMEAGDLETTTHEMCIDLGVGTGILIPLRGTPDQPIIFFAPPPDEVALGGDLYGRTNMLSWRRAASREAILTAFPKGNFSSEFRDAAKGKGASVELQLYQDFQKGQDGVWRFFAYCDRDCTDFITQQAYRTKPFASPRYFRVSGEIRGRGPVLLALPTIKTVNKAQELALKSAAIQMLGIWGYRANSGFNPDTAPQSPGSFWAMQSTGGILGPDVSRLDPANGRIDIAQMIIEGQQQQIKDALHDGRLTQSTGTPKSASEIAGLMRQNARVHLGGFMRMWREAYPEIVPRCAEILESFGYLGGLMDFNRLIVSVGVRSPMAAALSAEAVQNIAHYAELTASLHGGDVSKMKEHLDLDHALDDVADGLMIPKRLVPDADQRAAMREQNAQQQQQAMAAELAQKAAPQVAAGAMKLIQGGQSGAVAA